MINAVNATFATYFDRPEDCCLANPGHEFEPIQSGSHICGYVDGDDIMCGHLPEEHKELDKNADKKWDLT